MELGQLEFFLKVIEEGSFSKAAARVYRTQPAVSIAIRRLEEELGAPLLDRSQKSPTLTEAGQILHDYARRIIALRDEARAAMIKELGHESFLAHNVKAGSRLKVVETFAKHRTPLNIALELATIETIKRFVQQQVGIAFVPRMCVAEELERGTLATIPVRGLTYQRVIWASHRRGATLPYAAAAFVELLRRKRKSTDG